MKYGIDYILGSKYKHAILKAHPEGFGAGFLLNVLGVPSSLKIIKKLAESGRTPFIRVHLVWKDDHIFRSPEKRLAIKRAKRIASVIESHPEIKWYVSPFLEPHKAPGKLYNQTLRLCRAELPPATKLVSTSLEGDVLKQADFTEMHHGSYKNVAGKKIFSYDGVSATSSNIKAYKQLASNSELFFLWNCKLNGKTHDKDRTPRSQRTNWATPKDIKALAALV